MLFFPGQCGPNGGKAEPGARGSTAAQELCQELWRLDWNLQVTGGRLWDSFLTRMCFLLLPLWFILSCVNPSIALGDSCGFGSFGIQTAMCFNAKVWEDSLPQYLLITLPLAEILINGEVKKTKTNPTQAWIIFLFLTPFQKIKENGEMLFFTFFTFQCDEHCGRGGRGVDFGCFGI